MQKIDRAHGYDAMLIDTQAREIPTRSRGLNRKKRFILMHDFGMKFCRYL
jgi:hypothetical protein